MIALLNQSFAIHNPLGVVRSAKIMYGSDKASTSQQHSARARSAKNKPIGKMEMDQVYACLSELEHQNRSQHTALARLRTILDHATGKPHPHRKWHNPAYSKSSSPEERNPACKEVTAISIEKTDSSLQNERASKPPADPISTGGNTLISKVSEKNLQSNRPIKIGSSVSIQKNSPSSLLGRAKNLGLKIISKPPKDERVQQPLEGIMSVQQRSASLYQWKALPDGTIKSRQRTQAQPGPKLNTRRQAIPRPKRQNYPSPCCHKKTNNIMENPSTPAFHPGFITQCPIDPFAILLKNDDKRYGSNRISQNKK